MISEIQAIDLLKRHLKDEARINHCLGVADIAFDLATKIKKRNPSLDINPDKVKVAGILHDIGRCKDEGCHEINSQSILENEGLNEIKDIIMHGFLFEQMYLKTGNQDNTYLPKGIENKILVLADMYYNQKQQRVSLEERFDDTKKRFAKDKDFLKAVELAWPRFLKIEREINDLL